MPQFVNDIKHFHLHFPLCQNLGFMTTIYITTFVVVCAINDYMWLHDHLAKLSLSFLPSSHKCGHKHHSMTFTIVAC